MEQNLNELQDKNNIKINEAKQTLEEIGKHNITEEDKEEKEKLSRSQADELDQIGKEIEAKKNEINNLEQQKLKREQINKRLEQIPNELAKNAEQIKDAKHELVSNPRFLALNRLNERLEANQTRLQQLRLLLLNEEGWPIKKNIVTDKFRELVVMNEALRNTIERSEEKAVKLPSFFDRMKTGWKVQYKDQKIDTLIQPEEESEVN